MLDEPVPALLRQYTREHTREWSAVVDAAFYVAGPYDNPRAILRTLDRTCGEGNYHYLVPIG